MNYRQQTAKKYKIKCLEFNLSHTCNLRCEHCDHLAPYYLNDNNANKLAEFDNGFSNYIEILAKHAEVEDFLFIGGEPLLNKNIAAYVDTVKRHGLAKNLCLISNGFLIPQQSPELLKKFDLISVMSYSSKPLPEETKQWITDFCKNNKIKFAINPTGQFHKTFVTKKHGKWLAKALFLTCPLTWRQRCYVMYNGQLSRCARIPFISDRLNKTKIIDSEFANIDSLKIEDVPDFAARMDAYFTSTQVPQACHYCLGGVAKPFPHRQLTLDEIKNEIWTKETDTFGSIYFPRLLMKFLKLKFGIIPQDWLKIK